MSRANLVLQGQTIRVGEAVTLEPDADVAGLVALGMLIVANPDGSFSDPPPPPVFCCGRS